MRRKKSGNCMHSGWLCGIFYSNLENVLKLYFMNVCKNQYIWCDMAYILQYSATWQSMHLTSSSIKIILQHNYIYKILNKMNIFPNFWANRVCCPTKTPLDTEVRLPSLFAHSQFMWFCICVSLYQIICHANS